MIRISRYSTTRNHYSTMDGLANEFLYMPTPCEKIVHPQIRTYLLQLVGIPYINYKIKRPSREYLDNIYYLYYDSIVTDYALVKLWGINLYPYRCLWSTEFYLYHTIRQSSRGRIRIDRLLDMSTRFAHDMDKAFVSIPGVTSRVNKVQKAQLDKHKERTAKCAYFSRNDIIKLTDSENNMNLLHAAMIDDVQYLVIEEDYYLGQTILEYAKSWAYSSDSYLSSIAIWLPEVPTEWRGVALNTNQYSAVQKFDQYNFTMIAGGAGTGKTTLLIYIMWRFLITAGESIVYLLAPTNMAAENMRERFVKMVDINIFAGIRDPKSRVIITTIHSFVNTIKKTGYPYRSLIIVDEASMLDNILVQFFEYNLQNGHQCKLIMVGDNNQLRPIARDSIFTLLLDMHPQLTTNLITNYRSGDSIIQNSFMILKETTFQFDITENFVVTEYDARKDIIFMDCIRDAPELSMDNIMYITHRNDDVIYINRMVREELYLRNNISLDDLRGRGLTQKRIIYKYGRDFGVWEWAIGDRCVCKVNQKQIFNGSIGTVVGYRDKHIVIKYRDVEVNVPYGGIWPAYAITVHGSQGQEWDSVIFCDFTGEPILRSLLYVAITRAKKQLYIKRIRSEESSAEPYEFSVVDEDEGMVEWLGDILNYT